MADESKTSADNPPAIAGAVGGAGVVTEGRNPWKRVSFVLEFATKHNELTLCPITKRLYRGRFDMTNVKSRLPDDRFADCPDIPGVILIFDGPKKTVEVRDPLEFKENREVLVLAQKAHQAMNWPKPEPDRPRVYANLDDNRLHQWLYWARRWVDGKQVERREGVVPSMEEIDKFPGVVERSVFDTSPKRERFPNMADIPKYLTVAEAAGLNNGNG